MQELLNNRYRILQTLGRGGCGETFLAEDTHMPSHRKCVIKQLKPVTHDPLGYRIVRERFEREAAILEMIGRECEQVPKLHAYFTENQEFYLVQDWIDGKNLEQKVSYDGPLSEHAVRQILVQILPVLNYLHGRGIIHRDIKPANIMLREHDGKPVLIDFGAVKELVTTVVDARGMSTSTIVIGSPDFMPPEQAMGQPVFASDLYGLGWTAIFLLTGKVPHEMNISGTQSGWRTFAPQVSPKLADVLDKAIRPVSTERYESAAEMLRALQLPDTVPFDFISSAPTLLDNRNERRPDRRTSSLMPIVLGATVILLLLSLAVGFGLYSYSQWRAEETRKLEQERTLREAAEQQRKEAERRAQEAESAAAAEKARRDQLVYHIVQISNQTNIPVNYQVLQDNGDWFTHKLEPGAKVSYWRKNDVIVRFDHTLNDGDYFAEKKYSLAATTVTGHVPNEADAASAQLHYFALDASGNLDLYIQK